MVILTNHGGTLSMAGMLFVNHATWAHVLDRAASILGADRADLLTQEELAALGAELRPMPSSSEPDLPPRRGASGGAPMPHAVGQKPS